MTAKRFPYEESPFYPNDAAKAKRWYETLERLGSANVRARLAQKDAGSAGAISIGTEQAMTIGFAQDWLAWHDKQKTESETAFRGSQIFWTRLAALAATVVAIAGVVGWAVTIWRKW